MPRKPLVSVVILSYNRPLELAEGPLKSLEKQTYSQTEILVVDNRSEAHRRDYSNYRAISAHAAPYSIQRTSVFTGGMKQRKIALAAGEYVFLTEDDIIPDPDCIHCLVDYLNEHPGGESGSHQG